MCVVVYYKYEVSSNGHVRDLLVKCPNLGCGEVTRGREVNFRAKATVIITSTYELGEVTTTEAMTMNMVGGR